MLIWKVEELLRRDGIPVESMEGGRYLEIRVPQAWITIEPRPHYCDRGNFIVKVTPYGDLALSLDEQDGFPRYYFTVLACASEILAWMSARGILPPPDPAKVAEEEARKLGSPPPSGTW
jgi:hypothetical protein